jgi:hypothetical protein
VGSNGEVRLPYEHCWFDYVRTVGNIKMGVLTSGMSNVPYFDAFVFMKPPDHPWGPFSLFYEVYPNIAIGLHEKSVEIRTVKDFYRKSDKENIVLSWGQKALTILNLSLLLLSCKNIGTEKNYPPEALNKKRLKHHKQPLFTYHTLVLKPVGKKQESIPRHLWENRIHLCRGHFKTYTEDKPLFGHITGRFWWQPSVRGRNRDGIVMKDYVVEAATA